MKKKLVCILAFVMLLSACGGGEVTETSEPEPSPPELPSEEPAPTPTPTPKPTPTPTPSPTPTPTPDPNADLKGLNPLTGLPTVEEDENKRPLAIMYNNLKVALPMCGITSADIIYEAPAEGGVTRVLAFFLNPTDIPRIGSVRSTRAYFLDLAHGHDAIMLHAGGSPEALSEIPKRGITNFDGIRWDGTLYYRDAERRRTAGLEHSMFTTGALIEKYVCGSDKRLEHEDDYIHPLRFTDDGTPKGGAPVQQIKLFYSDYKTGIFDYDEETGLFLVSQYGKPFIDGNDGSQIAVRNVIIVQTEIWQIKGDSAGRLAARMTGSGEGFYACGGKYIPITWSKKSSGDPFVYTLEDGTPLVLGRGKTYINIFPLAFTPEFFEKDD